MSEASRVRQQVLLRQASGYIELGELLVETDKPVPASAARLLRRALDSIHQLAPPVRESTAALLVEGEALRALGRWSEAVVPLETVVARDTERVEAWLGLGWCLKRLGRLSEAILALRGGLEAAGEQAILHYNLACYLSLSGDASTAVEHLSRAISLDARYRDLTGAERDFDPIRDDPRFVAATGLAV